MTADPSTSPENLLGGVDSVEVELKFDVDADTPLPDWSAIPGITTVGDGAKRDLNAVYFDTSEYTLAAAGYAVRRRTGGPDEGWHIKGPSAGDARTEIHWPLDDDGRIPEGVTAAIAVISALADAPLSEIARIRTSRTAYALRDGDGRLVAEFADDHVASTDVRSGKQRSWREWEFELGPAAPEQHATLLRSAGEAVAAAGGRRSASASKLARALGY